jgi:hypothetical protein
MKVVISIFISTILIGCAAPLYKISLYSNGKAKAITQISVKDNRLDQKLYITGIGIGGTHVYMYEATPTIIEALDSGIQSSLTNYALVNDISVSLEELIIKNKEGFAKADRLSCIIESTVSIGSQDAIEIRTMSINDKNMSPLLTTSGKLIIDQCINEHSRDIALFIKEKG